MISILNCRFIFITFSVYYVCSLIMLTTSQFLHIRKFEVSDTLEKTLLWYFYIGLQSSDWMNFLPCFCKNTQQEYLSKHILPPLWLCGKSITEFSIFSTHFNLLSLVPIYWKFGNFNPIPIIANPPPHRQVKDKPHCTIQNFSSFFFKNEHVFKDYFAPKIQECAILISLNPI